MQISGFANLNQAMKNIVYLIFFSLLANSLNCSNSGGHKPIDQSVNNHVDRIEFVSRGDTLVGYLNKPLDKKEFPVIVVLHAASYGHHDSDIYNHLEKSMNDIGVGVFTYDRRGSGESQGNSNSTDYEALAIDALQAVRHLKQRDDIENNIVGLYGISQGGWLSPLAYSIDPSDISFMILVSSSGVGPAKQMEYSAVITLKMHSYTDSIINIARHLRYITNEYYRGNREREPTQKQIDKYRNEEWFDNIYLPWRGNLPKDVGTTRWIHEMDFDPTQYFSKVDIPILLIYGETDRWVPIEASKEIWQDILKKNGNNKSDFFDVESVGHMMILNEEDNPSTEVISEKYTGKIKQWVSKIIQSKM